MTTRLFTKLSFLNQKDFSSWQEYYFQYQFQLAQNYYIPLIQHWGVEVANKSVLDIGCGNGGFTSAFAQADSDCTGVEIRPVPWPGGSKNPRFLVQDITSINASEVLGAPFDIIILRDVIEHIALPQKHGFFRAIDKLIHPESKVLVTFPPFYSPFGLHQQTLLKRGLKKIPFLGWIPEMLLTPILEWSGETEEDIQEIAHIRECRMTISAFRKLANNADYFIENEKYFHIRPSHEIRYGWKTRESNIGNIPILGEIMNLGTVFLLEKISDSTPSQSKKDT